MENKQNGTTYSPKTKLGGLNAMKRKVPFAPETVVVSTQLAHVNAIKMTFGKVVIHLLQCNTVDLCINVLTILSDFIEN